MSTQSWAKRPLGDNPANILDKFQEGLEVRLIATERANFRTCTAEEALGAVVARNASDNFDFLPVIEPAADKAATREKIIGLVELVPFLNDRTSSGLVRDHMRLLSEENLIGADASILTFVQDADRHGCRLVVEGSAISGLVSLSDLQRLPVRAALFAMVTHLEIVLTNVIRSEFGEFEDWFEQLPATRQAGLQRRLARAKSQDKFVDELLFTEFCDKRTLITKSPNFRWPKTEFERDLKRIESLRNDLAHANEYAATREAASETCGTVRLMDKWIKRPWS